MVTQQRPPKLPTDDEFRTLFAHLTPKVRAQVLKQIIMARIDHISCSRPRDLATLSKVLTLLFKNHK